MKSGSAHINCLKWNSAGSRCLAGCSDGVLRLFDLQQKDCVAQWQAHQGEIHTVDVSTRIKAADRHETSGVDYEAYLQTVFIK